MIKTLAAMAAATMLGACAIGPHETLELADASTFTLENCRPEKVWQARLDGQTILIQDMGTDHFLVVTQDRVYEMIVARNTGYNIWCTIPPAVTAEKGDQK